MKTKNKILLTALSLFNKRGVKDVTLRQIALEIGISQGNLNYHYKTKADLIAELYYQLVDEMNTEMEKIVQDQAILPFLYKSSLISMQTLYNYRFILQDLYKVLETNDKLKRHYVKLQDLRKQQYLALFDQMIQHKLIREKAFEGEYERLYERMNILGDNWINAAFLFNIQEDSLVSYYHQLLFEVIFPYLTEEGRKQYFKLIP
ncbi:TetR/AcrR family transcriptional regulator [Marivirga arenosa]|uniref:TetR/AcrR family transcriptional regulator n=1 Tax=Marivirga arenosa TaxID=3059076 RepID=A0AA51X545_9BACT|nr:TetR/AcrR family transcriptional regulator [Marivirga sp. BKB1-2]WNB17059.1 TetR/AcrR family transcriptional regulator [Marivirga sp. BKB1-2]